MTREADAVNPPKSTASSKAGDWIGASDLAPLAYWVTDHRAGLLKTARLCGALVPFTLYLGFLAILADDADDVEDLIDVATELWYVLLGVSVPVAISIWRLGSRGPLPRWMAFPGRLFTLFYVAAFLALALLVGVAGGVGTFLNI